jgi:hypothetical protein
MRQTQTNSSKIFVSIATKTYMQSVIMATAASTTTLLPAALESSLQEVIARANHSAAGIKAILLSTTEGVPLGRCIGANNNNNNGESSLHEDVLATIESVWAPASKQFPVLGLSKLLQVTAIYDHGVLMHVYLGPVVSTSYTVLKL